MNDADKELLVKLIDSGINTYASLREALPHIYDTEWKYLGVPSMCAPNTDVARLKEKLLLDEASRHELSDDDTFELTIYGENLLHQLHKEAVRDKQAAEAMALNKRIFAATLIGVAIAAIGVLIALLK